MNQSDDLLHKDPGMKEIAALLLSDIAEIRKTVLMHCPNCLVRIAPAIVRAEEKIKDFLLD